MTLSGDAYLEGDENRLAIAHDERALDLLQFGGFAAFLGLDLGE